MAWLGLMLAIPWATGGDTEHWIVFDTCFGHRGTDPVGTALDGVARHN